MSQCIDCVPFFFIFCRFFFTERERGRNTCIWIYVFEPYVASGLTHLSRTTAHHRKKKIRFFLLLYMYKFTMYRLRDNQEGSQETYIGFLFFYFFRYKKEWCNITTYYTHTHTQFFFVMGYFSVPPLIFERQWR